MKKLLVVFLSVLLILTSGCSSSQDKPEGNETGLSFTAGTYNAESKGRNGAVKVEVTFDEASIVDVKVVEHEETPGISDAPIERIPAQIVEEQSLNIDAVASATMTSNAVLAAVEDCVNQAGGDVEALKSVVKEENKEAETIREEAEIVIVGGGAAGMMAAVRASQLGAESVIVLEKTATIGGNAAISGGFYDSTDQIGTKNIEMTEVQLKEVERISNLEPVNDLMGEIVAKLQEQVKEYEASGATYLFDSPELATLQYYEESRFGANLELLYEMERKNEEVYQWFMDAGLNWIDLPTNMIGGMWRRAALIEGEAAGIGYFKKFEEMIEENNYPVTIHLETKGEELMVEDGKVIGVKATAADGTKYEVTSENGVLLATGGFSQNVEMREKYNNKWAYVGEKLLSTSKPAAQGDGINMALEVGAALTDMGNIQILPIADPDDGQTITMLGNTTNIFINKEGKRFVDETKDRDTLTNEILKQTDSIFYVLSSADNAGLDENGVFFMSGMNIRDLVANGDVIMADTVEELAEKLEMDPAVLKATVDNFNKAVETGKDEEFGRIRFDSNAAYINGPFYACPRKPASHNCKGGVVVNTDTQVLDEAGNVIPGLYAAGETTGGRYRSGLPEAFTTAKTFAEYILGE